MANVCARLNYQTRPQDNQERGYETIEDGQSAQKKRENKKLDNRNGSVLIAISFTMSKSELNPSMCYNLSFFKGIILFSVLYARDSIPTGVVVCS